MSEILDSIEVSVDAAAVVFIIAGTGAFLTRKNIITKEGASCISNLTIKLFLPCLIFSELMKNLSLNDIEILGLTIIACLLHIAIGAFYGWFISLITRAGPQTKLAMAAVGFNNLPIVIVYAQVLGDSDQTPDHFKSKGVQYALFYYCFLTFTKWTIAYSMMKPSKEELQDRYKKIEEPSETEDMPKEEEAGPKNGSFMRPNAINESFAKNSVIEPKVQEGQEGQEKQEEEPETFWWKVKKTLNPPMIATFVAIPLALIPYMKKYVFSGSGAVLRQNLFGAITRMGQVAPTVIILYLGTKLSKGYPPNADIKTSTLILVIFGKLVFMPCVGYPIFYTLYDLGVTDEVFPIIMLIAWSTPTSLQLLMICAAHKSNEENLAKIALFMYLASIVTLSVFTTITLYIF